MNRRPLVTIAGKEGPYNNAFNALSQLDLSHFTQKRILLKPNVGRAAAPEHGYNTHPQAVAAVIDVIKKWNPVTIAIGESPLVGINTFEAFKKAGITDIANERGIELIDFDEHKPVSVDIPHPRVLTSTRIAAAVFEFDYLVSIPVAKTHMHTGVTLGFKNLKGCLYRHEKVRYHQLEYIKKEYPEKTLDSAISDLISVLQPDLTVVDGYMGMEGLGPSGGEPKNSNFAVASLHPMAADIFACKLMGIDPKGIPHLRLIAERNKYSLNQEDYTPNPTDYYLFSSAYKKPPQEISVQFEGVQVYEKDACSSCLSTLMLFLKRFHSEMEQYVLDDGKFHIAIGKGIDKAMKGTVFVGNCTRHMKEHGVFVKGCPPVPTRIYETIVGCEPDVNEPEVD